MCYIGRATTTPARGAVAKILWSGAGFDPLDRQKLAMLAGMYGNNTQELCVYVSRL